MRETCEFRVVEELASKLFAPDEGKRLGDTVRKIELATDDPRFEKMGEFQRETSVAEGRSFFHGWNLERQYSRAELTAADCFHLRVTTTFEPAGEECGTKYDESWACPHVFAPETKMEVCGYSTTIPAATCGVGAKQASDLFLDCKRIPKTKDISRTIAGEMVVSARLVRLFRQHGITGVEFEPIRQSPASRAQSKEWFQLAVKCADVEIVPPTLTGIDPFDHDAGGQYRCPLGHVIGLNLLSEVWVRSGTRRPADMVRARQFLGAREGLLRPEPIILVSPRAWRLLEFGKFRGYKVEVAHME